MADSVKIRCQNNGKLIKVPFGSTLEDIYRASGLQMEHEPVCAHVNNKVEGMNYKVYKPKDVEFLDITSPSGSRTYTRSLFFVLCKAVHDLYPEGSVVIDIPVSNGYYCDLHLDCEVTADVVARIKARMQQIVDAAIPIRHHEVPTEDAVKLFEALGTHSKVALLKTLGNLYTTYYEIDGYVDYFYGAMLVNTAQLSLFGLQPYYNGALLRIPDRKNPAQLAPAIQQDKMFEVFREHHDLQKLGRLSTIGAFNEIVSSGNVSIVIQVAEALQEKRIAKIAEQIAERKSVRMVLIAGPSSSGKTTTCKRIAVQLVTNGIRPVMISLDDYFVNRDETPLDEKGDYDYESIHALNLPLLNSHLTALLRGEEIELPKYNFQSGKSEKSGQRLRLLENDMLVVEGIHALNPMLTASVPVEQKFRVYASALTTILLDTHNYIPTTDNRLLRRIIRDYKYRGCSAKETIRRWPSVRRGEEKWIFPYQEEADAMFNTAMLYELAVIKKQAEPVLKEVPENCPEYAEAYRLRKFLRYIKAVDYDKLPPTSLLREFIGGSSFKY